MEKRVGQSVGRDEEEKYGMKEEKKMEENPKSGQTGRDAGGESGQSRENNLFKEGLAGGGS